MPNKEEVGIINEQTLFDEGFYDITEEETEAVKDK